jgi:hypothetical protein
MDISRRTTVQQFGPEHWGPETKLAVINECAELSGTELFRYCQRMSLTVALVRQWQADCILGLEKKIASKAATQAAERKQSGRSGQRRAARTPLHSPEAIRERLASRWG